MLKEKKSGLGGSPEWVRAQDRDTLLCLMEKIGWNFSQLTSRFEIIVIIFFQSTFLRTNMYNKKFDGLCQLSINVPPP